MYVLAPEGSIFQLRIFFLKYVCVCKRERTASGKFARPDNEVLVLYEFYLFILALLLCSYDFRKEYWMWGPAKEYLHKI